MCAAVTPLPKAETSTPEPGKSVARSAIGFVGKRFVTSAA
jgi:hypothetical protein